MPIQAVLFDLDNTLINRRKAFQGYAERFVDEFVVIGDSMSKTEIVESIIAADQDGYRKKRELYTELMTSLEMKSPVTADRLLEYWFSEFFKHTVVMDGAIELLEQLKLEQIKLGLITNGSVHSQNSKIDQVQLRSYFDAIIVSDEVQLKKPDPKIFELALERLGVSAASSIYVGDHPRNDITGAKSAGLGTVWIREIEEWDEASDKPDYMIRRLDEVGRILEELGSEAH
ncbi:HAD family hydrolase [Paenibacillus pasadenensis]|uniref:HAD family hydrolase n=1 Tax=Paenibacillus pasadenensis TaxID=217090 RepID=UPI00203FCF09|nr:HAD family hydrolase [Paenibacillus pasadenensis]MCM3748075.1 HAD family hydrolase [Paenibacillus pasadenensis]